MLQNSQNQNVVIQVVSQMDAGLTLVAGRSHRATAKGPYLGKRFTGPAMRGTPPLSGSDALCLDPSWRLSSPAGSEHPAHQPERRGLPAGRATATRPASIRATLAISQLTRG